MSSPNRLRHIDAMRGLAALAVIYTHVAEYGVWHGLITSRLERGIFALFIQYMDLGKVAVTVFFAISGFVIPFSIFRYRERPLRSFAISRFFRLYPAYWVSIPFGLILVFYLKGVPVTAQIVAANVLMVQEFIGVRDILGTYWTLEIELVFYVVCVVLFAGKRLNNRRAVTGTGFFFLGVAFALSVLRYLLDKKFPVALPLGLCVMFWGLCMRNYFTEDRARWKWPLLWLTAALIAAIPVISVLAYNKDMGFQETWYKYTTTYYLALALFYLFYRHFQLTAPVFVFLGRISYSVYLFGFIVQEAIITYAGDRIFAISGHGVILLTALITVAVSALIYRYVEAPAIELGKRLIGGRGTTRVSPLSQPTSIQESI